MKLRFLKIDMSSLALPLLISLLSFSVQNVCGRRDGYLDSRILNASIPVLVFSLGTSVSFSSPYGVAVDNLGFVYVADSGNDVIRKIHPNGIVTNIGITAIPSFKNPFGVAVDNLGNVFVADTGNSLIRVIDKYGVVKTIGENLKPSFRYPYSVFYAENTLFIADTGSMMIRAINSSNYEETFTTVNFLPVSMIKLSKGNGIVNDMGSRSLLALDRVNQVIRSQPLTIPYNITGPMGLYCLNYSSLVFLTDTCNSKILIKDAYGNIYNALDGYSGGIQLKSPFGVAVDQKGAIFVADTGNNAIRKITGVQFPPSPVPRPSPNNNPNNNNNNLISATSQGAVGTSFSFTPSAVAEDSSGYVYVADRGSNSIRRISPDGFRVESIGTLASPAFREPRGVAVDSQGHVYVADTGNSLIRKIFQNGTVVNIGLRASPPFLSPRGVCVSSSGIVFVADTGNRLIRRINESDDAVEQFQISRTSIPVTIAHEGSGGGLLVGDWGLRGVVWVISIGGVFRTQVVLNNFNASGITVDPLGRIFVTSFSSPTGLFYLQLSGLVTSVMSDGSFQFSSPLAVAGDGRGFLYVADGTLIRKLYVGTWTTTSSNNTAATTSSSTASTTRGLNDPTTSPTASPFKRANLLEMESLIESPYLYDRGAEIRAVAGGAHPLVASTGGSPTFSPVSIVVPTGEPFAQYVYSGSKPNLMKSCMATPTVIPTVFDAYKSSSLFPSYSSLRGNITSLSNSITFTSFTYKGIAVDGTCINWKSYIFNSLAIPLTGFSVSSLIFSFGSFQAAKQINLQTSKCEDSSVITAIISTLSGSQITSISKKWTCDGQEWAVNTCNGVPFLCVNCTTSVIAQPCGRSCAPTTATSFMATALILQPFNQYPVIRSITATSAKTSLTIAVNMSAAGVITCNRFLAGYAPTAIAQVQQQGISQTYNKQNQVKTITFNNLYPDTNYDIYCYTSTLGGQGMPLSAVLKTRIRVKTLCCRGIEWLSKYSFIQPFVQGVTTLSQELVFSFRLDTPPSSNVNIGLSIKPSTSCTTPTPGAITGVTINPSQFQFNAKSPEFQGSFVIRATSSASGCYELFLKVTSSSDVYNNGSIYVTVNSIPNAPVITSAIFASEGKTVLITFDTVTDQGKTKISSFSSSFSCDRLLTFSGSSGCSCNWLTTRQLQIVGSKESFTNLLPGSSITLVDKTLRAACLSTTDSCTNYPFSSIQVVTLTAPANLVSLSASLIAPSTVGLCAPLSIDPTGSSGNAGRPWQKVSWAVSGLVSSGAIQTYLNSQQSTDFPIKIPKSLLSAGTLSITLSVTNFLGSTSSASVSVVLSESKSIPLVKISAASLIYRWQSFDAVAIASVSSCSNSSSQTLSYSWSMYNGLTYLPLIVSTSLNPRKFLLPAFTLAASTTYTLRVQVTTITGNAASATTTFSVGRSGLVARMKGGECRSVSILSPVVIDASNSYDIDYPETSSNSLNYTWSCFEQSPNYGDACGFVLSNSEVVTIPVGSMIATKEYNISVYVTASDGATSSISSLFLAVGYNIPIVTFKPVATKYSVNDRIIITSNIQLSGVAYGNWSSLDTTLDLKKITNTPVSKILQPSANTISLNLVIKERALVADRTYAFRLDVTYRGTTRTAFAQVSVVINQPPIGGSLAVTPPTGIAFNTSYLISTFNWMDDSSDFPITNAIGYYTVDSSSIRMLKSASQVLYVNSMLEQGLSSLDYVVTCIVFVRDVYGSQGNTTTTTIVLPSSTAVIGLQSLLSSSLQSAKDSSNADLIIQVVNTIAGAINSADCSAAPSCTPLNRLPCSSIANTCGPCQSGFVGIPGSANTPCNSSTTSSLRRTGESCSQDWECISYYCDGTTGNAKRCISANKPCPNSCNGRGTCVYYDRDHFLIPSCDVEDRYCAAACNCTEGFKGKDCSLRSIEFDQKRGMREDMCESIYNTLKFQDVTQDVVESRANSIAYLLSDVDQISDKALEHCTLALIYTIGNYSSIAGLDTTVNKIFTALSNVLEKGNRLSTFLVTQITEALKTITIARQDHMGVGETGTSIVLDNLKLYCVVVHAGDLNSSSINMPQSDLEKFLGEKAVKANVMTGSGSYDNIGICISQFTKNPYKSSGMNSSSVRIQTTYYDSFSSNEVVVVLDNVSPVTYRYNASFNGTVGCEGSGNPYNVTVHCSYDTTKTLVCPGTSAGSISYTCPEVKNLPTCSILNGLSFMESSKCSVISYTADNTTCRCFSSDIVGGRRLTGSSAVVAQELASSSSLVVNNFISTYAVAATLDASTIRKNFVILITVLVVFSLCLFGYLRDSWYKFVPGFNHGDTKRKRRRSSIASVAGVTTFFETVIPVDFRMKPWYLKLWEKMLENHPYLSVFAPLRGIKYQQTRRWLIMSSKIVNIMFIDALLAVFRNNSVCLQYGNKKACETPLTLDFTDKLCTWNVEKDTCEYNDNSDFFARLLVFTTFVVLVTCPLDVICAMMTNIIFKDIEGGIWDRLRFKNPCIKVANNRIQQEQNEGASDNEITAATSIQFQLHNSLPSHHAQHVIMIDGDIQYTLSMQSKLLLAARLVKMQTTMDDVSPEEELNFLVQRADTLYVTNRHQKAPKLVALLQKYRDVEGAEAVLVNHRPSQISKLTGCGDERYVLLSSIIEARQRAEQSIKDINKLETDEEKEVKIMRLFLVELYSGYMKNLASAAFFDNDESTTRHLGLHYLAAFILPTYLFAALFFVLLFGISLGPDDANMWLLTLVFSILQDIFILKPAGIWVKCVVLSSLISDNVNELANLIKDRVKFLLKRKRTFVGNESLLVQHLNAGCRAARAFPHLQTSRIIMTVNDFDLPHAFSKRVNLGRSILLIFYSYLIALFALFLLILTTSPTIVQEVLYNTMAVLGAQFGFYYMKSAWTVNFLIPIGIIIIIVGLIALREYFRRYMYRRQLRKVTALAVVEMKHMDEGNREGGYEKGDFGGWAWTKRENNGLLKEKPSIEEKEDLSIVTPEAVIEAEIPSISSVNKNTTHREENDDSSTKKSLFDQITGGSRRVSKKKEKEPIIKPQTIREDEQMPDDGPDMDIPAADWAWQKRDHASLMNSAEEILQSDRTLGHSGSSQILSLSRDSSAAGIEPLPQDVLLSPTATRIIAKSKSRNMAE